MATIIVSSALTALAGAKGNAQLIGAAHLVESRLRIVRVNEQINVAKPIYILRKQMHRTSYPTKSPLRCWMI